MRGLPYRAPRHSSSALMTHKVSLSRLTLTDFRNYAGLSVRLDDRHVVLTGQNGSGKTNLMEAVSFLSPGRGLRRAAYQDVVRNGAEGGFSVFAALEGIEIDVAGKPDCNLKPGFWRSRQARPVMPLVLFPARKAGQDGTDDERPRGRRSIDASRFGAGMAVARTDLQFFRQSGFPAVFLTIEHLNRLARHDGGNGVLVDKLRVTIAAQ